MTCGCPVCMTVVSNESLSQTVMNSTVAVLVGNCFSAIRYGLGIFV